jgi:predicted enzyme related to lactoylglutathione lyase
MHDMRAFRSVSSPSRVASADVPQSERHVHCRLHGRYVAGLYSLPDTPPRWKSYVTVDDADAMAARAAELGGTVVEAPFDVGPECRRAVVADPGGAHAALWQRRTHPGAGVVNYVGCWCSNQLQAPDPPLAFYRELLGREVEAGDGYSAVRNGGADNGGILAADGPPAWLVYFHVDDADKATRDAEAAGAAVLLVPETIGLGPIAILADPQGAAFGVFEGEADP